MPRVIDGTRKGYTLFFNSILEIDKKLLSTNARLCYLVLKMYAGQNEECYPSYKAIGERMGCSRNTAIKAIKELEDKKLIFKTTRKNKKDENMSNTYIVLDAENFMKDIGKSIPDWIRKAILNGEL